VSGSCSSSFAIPEVQQPHLPRIGHLDVRRLDVPVQRLVAVCALHHIRHLQEELERLPDAHPARIAPGGERLTGTYSIAR